MRLNIVFTFNEVMASGPGHLTVPVNLQAQTDLYFGGKEKWLWKLQPFLNQELPVLCRIEVVRMGILALFQFSEIMLRDTESEKMHPVLPSGFTTKASLHL
ncbi:uncharacterized protein [Macaca nemestrina]|uniref:uncharacterized protein isoform X2 n=1 Tax=Macaca nemestrina TaxID=9545 RepID=UPI0039B853F9